MEALATLKNWTKPRLNLVGMDGNAFAVLGAFQRVARKAGNSQEDIKRVMDEAMGGDYDHLVRTVMAHIEL